MINYAEFVEGLFKEMGSEAATAMHAAAGASGEAGELLDAVKKFWVYNKPLDIANMLEELGDMMFYMQKLMNMYGWSWDNLREANIAKLQKRYPTGTYSDAQAQARADKNIPVIPGNEAGLHTPQAQRDLKEALVWAQANPSGSEDKA